MNLDLDRGQWKSIKFGDIVRNINDSIKDPSAEGIDRVIAMEHLDPGELQIIRWGNIADGTTFTRRVRCGQTLFGKRRAYQRKAAYAEFDAICSGDILAFEAVESKLLPELLPFLVQSERFHANAVGTSAGSLSPRTNWKDLAAFAVSLPPIDQQRRIVDILWAVENSTRRERELKESATDVLRTARNEGLASLDASPAILGDALTGITAGRSLEGYGGSASSDRRGVLRVSAVGPGGFVASENKELVDQAAFLTRYAIRSGDLLVTRANTAEYVGRPAIVDRDYPNLMLSDKTLRLEVDPEIARVPFVLETLLSAKVREAIGAVATGTGAAMKNISQEQLRSIAVPLPELEVQDAFLSRLDAVRQTVEATSTAARTTAELKQKIMEEVFGS